VIGHEHVTVKPDAELVLGFFQVGLKSVMVRLREEDLLALVPASGDVVKSPGVFDSERSSHAAALSLEIVPCQDLTPLLLCGKKPQGTQFGGV
jgi:hypothetical protein